MVDDEHGTCPGERGAPLRLVPLAPSHAGEILAGQDDALVAEVFGARWEPAALAGFLERSARWRESGPIRELAAVDPRGELIGGGGTRRVGPHLERGWTELSYWVLPQHRGRGWGERIADALTGMARGRPLLLRISPGNAASEAVARRLGFERTARISPHPADPTRRVVHWEHPGRPLPTMGR